MRITYLSGVRHKKYTYLGVWGSMEGVRVGIMPHFRRVCVYHCHFCSFGGTTFFGSQIRAAFWLILEGCLFFVVSFHT